MRVGVIREADRLLTGLQRSADGPEGVNSRLFGNVCALICHFEAAVAGEVGRTAWETTNRGILERVIWTVERDPGTRVLVAVHCRRVHWLEARLQPIKEEITLVPNQEL